MPTLGLTASMWARNLADIPPGSFRSITGYASEHFVIGRAMLCGYAVSVQGWRDGKYDGILESSGTCFRIETKGTTSESFATSAGGRAGGQIIPGQRLTREQPLSKEDSDFFIGVTAVDGTCYVVPTEIVDILQKKSFTLNSLRPFREKWPIFSPNHLPDNWNLNLEQIRIGFRDLSDTALRELYLRITGTSLVVPRANRDLMFTTFYERGRGMRPAMVRRHEWIVLNVWIAIFNNLNPN